MGTGSGAGIELQRGEAGAALGDPTQQLVYTTLNRHWKSFSIADGVDCGEVFNVVQVTS